MNFTEANQLLDVLAMAGGRVKHFKKVKAIVASAATGQKPHVKYIWSREFFGPHSRALQTELHELEHAGLLDIRPYINPVRDSVEPAHSSVALTPFGYSLARSRLRQSLREEPEILSHAARALSLNLLPVSIAFPVAHSLYRPETTRLEWFDEISIAQTDGPFSLPAEQYRKWLGTRGLELDSLKPSDAGYTVTLRVKDPKIALTRYSYLRPNPSSIGEARSVMERFGQAKDRLTWVRTQLHYPDFDLFEFSVGLDERVFDELAHHVEYMEKNRETITQDLDGLLGRVEETYETIEDDSLHMDVHSQKGLVRLVPQTGSQLRKRISELGPGEFDHLWHTFQPIEAAELMEPKHHHLSYRIYEERATTAG